MGSVPRFKASSPDESVQRQHFFAHRTTTFSSQRTTADSGVRGGGWVRLLGRARRLTPSHSRKRSTRSRILVSLLLPFLALGATRALGQDVELVGNYTNADASDPFEVGTEVLAQWFETGEANGYLLTRLQLEMKFDEGMQLDNLQVSLWRNATSGNNQYEKVANLADPATAPGTAWDGVLFSSPGTHLQPGTVYFIRVENDAAADTDALLRLSSSNAQTGLAGWAIDNGKYSRPRDGGIWTHFNRPLKFRLKGSVFATPLVEGVAVTSSPADSRGYETGETFKVAVTFSGDVTVTGTPALTLSEGANDRNAEYVASESTADTLVFAYTVVAGDSDLDGISIAANALHLPSGATIKAAGGTADALLDHASMPVAPARRVNPGPLVENNGIAVISTPVLESDLYGRGELIEISVAFDASVTVTTTGGTPTVTLEVQNVDRMATYASGSGTDTLVFGYRVQAGESDNNGFVVPADALSTNGGTLRGANGRDAVLDHDEFEAGNGHRINGNRMATLTDDITLTALTLDAGSGTATLTPALTDTVTAYSAAVTHADTSVTVAVTPTDSGALVTLPTDALSGTPGTQVALPVGDTEFSFTVRSSDRTLTRTYTVTVTRPPLLVTVEAVHPTAIYRVDDVVFEVTNDTVVGWPVTVAVTLSQDQNFLATNALSQTVTIPAGDASVEIRFGYRVFETATPLASASGTLTASLVDGSNYDLGTDASASVALTVADPSIRVMFDKANYRVAEGGSVEVTVVARTESGVPKPANAVFSIIVIDQIDGYFDDSAESRDYVSLGTYGVELTFTAADFGAAGNLFEARKSLTLHIRDDAYYEGTERMWVTLNEPNASDKVETLQLRRAGGMVCAPGQQCRSTVNIADDETAPVFELSVDPARIAEATGSDTTVTATITSGATYDEDQDVVFAFAGTATAGDDYAVADAGGAALGSPYEVELEATGSAVSVTLTALDDTVADDEETILVTATLGPSAIGAEQTVTITDDEGPPPAKVANVAVAEGSGRLTVSWDAVAGDGYKVQWRSGSETFETASADGREHVVEGAATTQYVITGLAAGTQYSIRVIAIKTGVADATPSDPVTGTPRTAAGDAALSGLAATFGATSAAVVLDPAFDPAVTSYRAVVASGVSAVTVTPTTNDANASVGSVPADADDQEAGIQLDLGPSGEDTPLQITVTAENGLTTRTYTLTVSRGIDICARHARVKHHLLEAIPGLSASAADDCTLVTTQALAGIATLAMDNEVLTGIQASDLAGLSGLASLSMESSSINYLAAGTFAGLTALLELDLADNALTSLPGGIFAPLTNLTSLTLTGNPGTPFGPSAEARATPAAAMPGTQVNLEGSVGAYSGDPFGRSLDYAWSQSTGPTVALANADSATAAFTMPDGSDGLAFDLEIVPDAAFVLPATVAGLWQQATASATVAAQLVPVTATFSGPGQVAEGERVEVVVDLSADPRRAVDIPMNVSASHAADLSGVPSSVAFALGETSKTLTIDAVADGLVENTETATLSFGPTLPAGVSAGGNHSLRIVSNDSIGVGVSPTTLTVDEGSTGSYTVRLGSRPSAQVTVTVAGGSADITVSPGALTFAAADWNAAVQVTVTVAEDTNQIDETVTLTHSANSADQDYGGIAIDDVEVTADDDDRRGFILSATTLTVTEEGAAADYTVSLDTAPTASVTVTVSSDNADVTASPSPLTFTTSDWSTAQTVSVAAGADDDADDDSATLTHAARDGGYDAAGASVAVVVTDNDMTGPGVTISPTEITVVERGRGAYTVVLDTDPGADVAIMVGNGRQFNEENLIVSPYLLTFTPSNWYSAQMVTVNAQIVQTDRDAVDHAVTLAHTVTADAGSDYESVAAESVVVTIEDSDTAAVEAPSSPVPVTEAAAATRYEVKLTSQPVEDVTVTVSGFAGTSLSVSPAVLTFDGTGSNWSGEDVTLEAQNDADADAETVTLTHAVASQGIDYADIPDFDVTVTIADDDTNPAGATLSTTTLTIDEGDAAGGTYTLVLDERPEEDVTVAIGGASGTDVAVSPATLTFARGGRQKKWNVPQTVTVTAAVDADAADDTVTLTHTAASDDAGYDGVAMGDLVVTVTDAMSPIMVPATLSVTEEDAAGTQYEVVLAAAPTGPVTVTVTSDNAEVAASPSALTFTTTDWQQAQTVTVTAAADDDDDNDTATLTHAGSGGGLDGETETVAVTVIDDDLVAPGVTISPTELTVTEEGQGTYTVVLDAEPVLETTEQVTVTVAGFDTTGLSVVPSTLQFTTLDWSAAQIVTVTSTDDADAADSTVTLTHAVDAPADSGYASVTADSVVVTEEDNDTAGVETTEDALTLQEATDGSYRLRLTAEPLEEVVVTVGGFAGTSLTASPATLTFTDADWGVLQKVDLAADNDADDADATVVLTHTVASLGDAYADVEDFDVTVTIEDDDDAPAGATLSTTALSVTEGDTASATYTLVLHDEPEAWVIVAIGAPPGAPVTVHPSRLVFTDSRWDEPKTITVSAAVDLDATDDLVTLSHTAASDDAGYAGIAIDEVEVTVADAGPSVLLDVSKSELPVVEGDAAGGNYEVVLAAAPTGAVTVTVTTDNADVSASPSSLIFETTTWNQAQTVTVTAAEDDDADADTATLTHAAQGGGYDDATATVAVTVSDDDTASTAVTLSVDPATVTEDAGATVTVTGMLNASVTTATTTVTVSVSTGTAAVGDFAAVDDFALTIDAGETSGTATFMFMPNDDAVDEDDETVTVGGSVQGLTVTAATLTIEDDDGRGVEITPTMLTVDEGGSATYTVVLSSQPTGTVTVTASVSGSTDLSVSPSTLTFAATTWADARTLTVSAAHDADAEADTATVSHTVAGADYASETADDVDVSVSEDETASTEVALSVNPTTVDENATATAVTVTGMLDDAPRTAATVVTVSVTGATASAADFTPVDDFTLTIDAGNTTGTASFTLTPVDDAIDDDAETLAVGGTAGGGLAVTTATLTIADDDQRGVDVTPTMVDVPEGGDSSYAVVLESQPTGAVTVTPTVAGNSEVTVFPTSLSFTGTTWSTAQTITVSAAHDADAEEDTANVSNAVSGADYDSVPAADVAVTVDDDETPSTQVILSVSPASVDEDAAGTAVTVTGMLDESPRTAETVLVLSVAGDTASYGDFSPVADFLLTIDAGETKGTATFTIFPDDDLIDEDLETVAVSGYAVGGPSAPTVISTQLTIRDDDERGVVVTPTTVNVPEGGSSNYVVLLSSQPTGSVTVAPTATTGSDVTVSPPALTFDGATWFHAQTVTVSAAEDDDAEPDTDTVTHAVAGADYGSATADNVAVTVLDNDTAATAVTLASNVAPIPENTGSRTVTVTGTLNGAPKTQATVVTVSVSAATASTADFGPVEDFSLTIDAGRTTGEATFHLTLVDDGIDEEDETLIIGGTTNGLTVIATELTISDNDTRGIRVGPPTLIVDEGRTSTYTVVLLSQPTGTVTVTPTASGSADVTVSPPVLTFTTVNYAAGQVVMVSAAQDADAAPDTATVAHAVAGADYASETADAVSVSVTDDETASTRVSLTLNPTTIGEGDGAAMVTVTGELDEAPEPATRTLTVSVSAGTGSAADYDAVADFTLAIAAGQTSGTATFTLTPVDDDLDEADETLAVGGTVPGLTVTGTTLTIEDDDERGIEVAPTTLPVVEGASSTYTVALSTQPTGPVTVTPSASGSPDVTVSPSALTFGVSDWSTPQTVTVTAAEDDGDADPDTATVTHAVTGADYGLVTADDVSVTVTDNETVTTAVDLSVSPLTVDENAGATDVTVTGTLNGAPVSAPKTVTVTVTGDSASANDFAGVSDFALTIDAGQSSGTVTFTLTPVDDGVDEENETLAVDGTVEGLTVTGTTLAIVDDDSRGVEVAPTRVTVAEGDSSTYTVVLLSEPTGTVTVTLSADGSPDVTVAPSALTFTDTDWSTAKTVTVAAAHDDDGAPDAATVTHAVSGADYALETAEDVAVAVDEDETGSTAIELTVNPSTVVEGAGATGVTVTAELDAAPWTTTTTMTVSVSAQTAAAGDFGAVNDFALTIAAGRTVGTATFTLTPTNDGVDENDETLAVDGTADGLAVTGTTLVIVDDDSRGVAVAPTTVTVPEGGSSTYTVVLTSQPTGAVTVAPSVGGSSDVTVSPAALTFATTAWSTAQTVTVTAAADDDADADEATVAHTVSGADYASETADDVAVMVTEDETPSTAVALTVAPSSVVENDGATSVTVTATLNEAPTTSATTLTVSVSADTASTADFAAVADFMLTIAAGRTSGTATFMLTPTGDGVDEENETLALGGTADGLTVTGTTLTIEDDDERGIEVVPTTLGVDEGGSSTYTVVLTSQPTGPVTVTPSVTGSTDVTVSPASLTFAVASWAEPQTMTVSAAQDDDAEADQATVAHAASGADYASETVDDLAVTVNEDERVSTAISLTLNPTAVGEGAGDTTVTVTGELDEAPGTAATTVTVSVSAATASASDFGAVADFVLTIGAGQTSGTAAFTLAPADDDIDEEDETLAVGGTAQGVTVHGTRLTIEDNDARGVEVSATALTVAEGGSATYTVVLSSQPTGAVTVTPSVAGSSDVTVSPAALTFAAAGWSTAQTVTAMAAEDEDAAADAATVTHAVAGADYASETAGTVTVTVADNETVSTGVGLTVNPANVGEDAGATGVTVTATLNGAPGTAPATVTVMVAGSSASADDFGSVADFALMIEAGESTGSATFTLTPADDDVDEENETLAVDGTADELVVTGTTLTIDDDDTRGVAVAPTTVTVAEGGSSTYTVVLLSEPTGPVTVTPSAGGSSDVTVSPSALTFPAADWSTAQTVTVAAAPDDDAAPDEATVTHVLAGADYASETVDDVAVRVTDDETASTAVQLSVLPPNVEEGGGATQVTVTGILDEAPQAAPTTVAVSVAGGTASASDFVAVRDFALTIDAGQTSGAATFTLAPIDDDLDEEEETLSVGGTVAGLTVTAAELTIRDDDTRGVETATTTVTVLEGGSGTYTMVLSSQPTGPVTITPSVIGSPEVTVLPSVLTFTAADWSTAQTVTVTAAPDDDAAPDAATVTHTVAGADYGSVTTNDIAVTVTDDETASTAVLLSVLPPSVEEGGGATEVAVTGTLDEAPRLVATTVALSVAGGTGSADDFEAVAGFELTIDVGQTSATATFTLTPVDDDIHEDEETLTVGGTTTDLTVTAAELAILDDDERGVEAAPLAVIVAEDGTATYTVVLSSQPTGPVTVTPSVTGSPDVTVTPPALTFTATDWSTAQTVTVAAASDDDAEADTATVAHAAAGADYDSAPADAVEVTVADKETESTEVLLSAVPTNVAEGAGATEVILTGSLNGAPLATATTMTVSVSGSTASAADFAVVPDFELTIDVGQPSATATFILTPTDDGVDEEDETITVAAVAEGLSVTAATLTIEDDDERGIALAPTAVSVAEGASSSYTVALLSEPTDSVTVTPNVSGSGDVTVAPTSVVFGVENWAEPRTVLVSAAPDDDADPDQATVAHAVSGGDYASVAAGSISVTVTDNDTASSAVVLALVPSAVGEGAGGTEVVVTGTLNGAIGLTSTTVVVSVDGDTASTADFASVTPFALTIDAGDASGTATFTLTPTDDGIDEPEETLRVGGSSPSLAVTAATLTIEDDDQAPGPPTAFAAVAGDSEATLAWNAPANVGTSPIDGYQYRYRSARNYPQTWTDVPDGADADADPGNETSHTVAGLTNGTTYAFQIRAVSAAGAGEAAADQPTARPSKENSAPTITTAARLEIDENRSVVTLTATDPDGDAVKWSKTGGADAAKFDLSVAGALAFLSAPDYEAPSDSASAAPVNAAANNEYIVAVLVSDGTADDERTLTIRVRNVDEDPVGVPTITGTAQEGISLTADTSGIDDPDGLAADTVFAYQWFRLRDEEQSEIADATAANYDVAAADVGSRLVVEARFMDTAGFLESVRSEATAAVIPLVQIPDAGLRAAIASALARGPDDYISKDDMASLTDLDADSRRIRSLTGLEFATGLTRLNLAHNRLANLLPIRDLVALTELYLNDNRIVDISPLAGLTALTVLYLDDNRIRDISPLAGLSALEDLQLGGNRITDISPLAALTTSTQASPLAFALGDNGSARPGSSLKRLHLNGNQITDISPLAELTSIVDLHLGQNQISDISPLQGLNQLQVLLLADNEIDDVTPLLDNAGLGDGDIIDLRRNPLESQSSETQTAMLVSRGAVLPGSDDHADSRGGATPLALGGSATGVIEFEYDIDVFRVEATDASDVAFLITGDATVISRLLSADGVLVPSGERLKSLVSLEFRLLPGVYYLEVRATGGSEHTYAVEALANPYAEIEFPDAHLRAAVKEALGTAPGGWIEKVGVKTLDALRVQREGVVDLTGLEFATAMTSLNLRGNAVADLSPLSGLAMLTSLVLSDNDIADLTPLAGLGSLTILEVAGNAVLDVSPLADLESLEWLDLGHNRISDIAPLAALARLRTLKLHGNEMDELSTLAGFGTLTRLWLQDNRIDDLAPVAGLTGLEELWLSDNRLDDLSPLRRLTELQTLRLMRNEIVDISILEDMTALRDLRLSGNRIASAAALKNLSEIVILLLADNTIADIAPLVENGGIGAGDRVDLRRDPLNGAAAGHVSTLEARGASVTTGDDDHADLRASATPLALGERVPAVIESAYDVDVFEFELAEATDIAFLTRSAETVVQLRDEDGRPMFYGFFVDGDPGFVVARELAPGTYHVEIRGRQAGVAYALEAVADPLAPVAMPDIALHAGIGAQLGRAPGEPLTVLDLANLTTLDAFGQGVADLTGLEYATGLSTLSLWGNKITDLSPLAGLDRVGRLNLAGNLIADLSPLAELDELTWLNLGGNGIVDLSPLAELTGLKQLWLYENAIADLSPLEGLVALEQLSLRGNEIVDVAPLTALTNLRRLLLADNLIVDASPLVGNAGLGDRDEVDLSDNPLGEASLSTHVVALADRGVAVRYGTALVHAALMYPAASDSARQGFVRIVNHSPHAGEVRVVAVDDTGRGMQPLMVRIGANEVVHFNSDDLEVGNRSKGLAGSTGPGNGDWRLRFTSDLAIEVLSYIRTRDGFLTSMHDFVPASGNVHRVAIFNPGININQVSWLRLVNAGSENAAVTITGIDDLGEAGDAVVEATVPAATVRMISAQQLESGDGFATALGAGAGKWRLSVESSQPIQVMSLLASPTGHLTNLSSVPANETEGVHRVPLFPSASDDFRQGFARVVNHSDQAGQVTVTALDDSDWEYDPLTLDIGANETAHFNSDDLEMGNLDKGLAGGTGAGTGGWRLELESDLELEVLSYIRTDDGFLTSMHDVAPGVENRHRVAIFNPGRNQNQVSRLRLINPGQEPVQVTITGTGGDGRPSSGEVSATIPAGAARSFTAAQLESGTMDTQGALGTGVVAKWQLTVESEAPITVMSLLQSPTGHLTNLSTVPGKRTGAEAANGGPDAN